jgi:predicted ATPase
MITKIEVDGYRLLDEFSATLGPLTVVIGANATGKSTVLDCLQCISQCVESPLNTVLGWHLGMLSLLNVAEPERKLSWRITFKNPQSSFWMTMPLEEERPLLYEVVLEADSQGLASPQYEALKDSEPKPGYPEPFKFLEATRHRRQIYNRRTDQLMPFDEVREAAGERAAVPDNNKALVVQAQEPALMLSQIRFFNDFPIPSWARLFLTCMSFYQGFDVSRFSALRTKAAEIKPVAVLSPAGENLGTVLHELLTRYEYRNVIDDVRDFLKAAYPTFEEIHCDTTYGTPPQVLCRIREKGMERSMELWEVSDGMLRFLCLATALMNPSVSPLIAIDEPEVGLHPRLLPVVADMIKTASEQRQVLVTTHSPDLLTCFDIADVAVMTRDDDKSKATWLRPSTRKSLVQMLKSVGGETLGDLLRSGEFEELG